MPKDDDMRQRLERVETAVNGLDQKVDGLERRFDGLEQRFDGLEQRFDGLEQRFDNLEKKVDQLPTRADFTTLTTKVTMLFEETKEMVNKAAEGYKATLDRIETDLGEFNKKVDVRFGDHDKVLANHNGRITVLEALPRPGAEGI